MIETERDKFQLEFIVDEIFPKRKVHLIQGPSGAGKTSLVFEMLKAWTAGEPVFGYKSHPDTWAYVSLDRDYDEVGNRCEAAGLDPRELPIYVFLEKGITLGKVMQTLSKESDPPKVLIVEAIGLLLGGSETAMLSYNAVGNFLRDALALCKKYDMTIIATHHTAKAKQGQGYSRSREKASGSGMWGAMSSTNILVDYKNPGDKDDRRRIVEGSCRVTGDFTLEYIMTPDGRFEPTTPIDEKGRQTKADAEVRILTAVPLGETKTFDQLKLIAENDLQMSTSTLKRVLNRLTTEGHLIKIKRGTYLRPPL